MQITILGKVREYEEGTSLLAISQDVAAEYASPIMLAMVNGKLKELQSDFARNSHYVPNNSFYFH